MENNDKNNEIAKKGCLYIILFFVAIILFLSVYSEFSNSSSHSTGTDYIPSKNITIDKETKRKNDSIVNATMEKSAKEVSNERSSTSSTGKVKASEWDGSVSQVKKYIKDNLNDPDSYKSVRWSIVYDIPGGYKVAHEYRAKNIYGGYVTKRQIFYLNYNGDITKIEE